MGKEARERTKGKKQGDRSTCREEACREEKRAPDLRVVLASLLVELLQLELELLDLHGERLDAIGVLLLERLLAVELQVLAFHEQRRRQPDGTVVTRLEPPSVRADQTPAEQASEVMNA